MTYDHHDRTWEIHVRLMDYVTDYLDATKFERDPDQDPEELVADLRASMTCGLQDDLVLEAIRHELDRRSAATAPTSANGEMLGPETDREAAVQACERMADAVRLNDDNQKEK